MTRPLLTTRGLTVRRPGANGDVLVLDRIDLDVAGGTITDVTGPSGAGKTTLLLALARLLPGAQGELALHGRPAAGWVPGEWRREVALLPQRPALQPGSVADELLLPFSLKVRAHAEAPDEPGLRRAMDDVGLDDVELARAVERLSVGQAARVALLRVLLTRPSVLLLDEPDAALDDDSAGQVTGMTARFVADGGGVLRVRHGRVDAAADRRLRLSGGRLSEVV